MCWGHIKIPQNRIWAQHTNTHMEDSVFHQAWAPRVVFTLHMRAPSSPRTVASCHTSSLGTCRKGIGASCKTSLDSVARLCRAFSTQITSSRATSESVHWRSHTCDSCPSLRNRLSREDQKGWKNSSPCHTKSSYANPLKNAHLYSDGMTQGTSAPPSNQSTQHSLVVSEHHQLLFDKDLAKSWKTIKTAKHSNSKIIVSLDSPSHSIVRR